MSWWNHQSSAGGRGGEGSMTPTPNCMSLPFCNTGSQAQGDFDDSRFSTTTWSTAGRNVGHPFVLATPPGVGTGVTENDYDSTAAAASTSSSDAMDLLSEEMQQLSVAEREKIFYDVNGVASSSQPPIIEETPEFLQRKLDELDTELESILHSHSSHRRLNGGHNMLQQLNQRQPSNSNTSSMEAYEKALQLSPQYVNDVKFRLMFLRSEEYNPTMAAKRIIRHFHEKLKLWGTEKLCKTITRDDLNNDDEKCLLNCMITCLGCDRAGRPVLFGFPHRRPNNVTNENMARVEFYVFMSVVMNNEVAQRKGAVGIMYVVGDPVSLLSERKEEHRIMNDVRDGCPVRMVSNHLCCSRSPVTHSIFYYYVLLTAPFVRQRVQVHTGPTIELQYKLLSFGISPHVLPLDALGEVVTDGHHRWLQLLKHNEAENKKPCVEKTSEELQGDCSLNSAQQELLDMPMEDIDIDLGDMMDTGLAASDDVFVDPFNLDNAVKKAQKSVAIPEAPKSSNVAASQPSDTTDDERIKISTEKVPDGHDDHEAKSKNTKSGRKPVLLPSVINESHRALPAIPRNLDDQKLLPPSFKPSPHTVILGRGKSCSSAPGTIRLKVLAQNHIDVYCKARTKQEKSAVVSSIIDRVQSECPVGAFVKKVEGKKKKVKKGGGTRDNSSCRSNDNGTSKDEGDNVDRYWEVTDSIARDKVASLLRDLLSDKYKSSTKNKVARRRKRKQSTSTATTNNTNTTAAATTTSTTTLTSDSSTTNDVGEEMLDEW